MSESESASGKAKRRRFGWREERDGFIRAFAGAWLFGIPMIFTMEMWWIGRTSTWKSQLVFAGIAFGMCLGLNYAAGFRRERKPRSLHRRLDDTIDALAVGLIAAAVTLAVINRIRLTDSLASSLGLVVLQALPLSVGASFANHVFRRNAGDPSTDEDSEEPEVPPRRPHSFRWRHLISELGVTAIGGVALGVSIAPTDEVIVIAAGLRPIHLYVSVLFSLVVSYAIVYASGFGSRPRDVPMHHASSVTIFAYAVSLATALATLVLFGMVNFEDGLGMLVAQTVVMAIPTTMGGAAGRLLV